MGFLFKWIFRVLLVWATVVMSHSCGSTRVVADDVPFTPPPGANRAAGGR
jgi:hypothetical protein